VSVYKRGDTWWYEFIFKSSRYRESTRQGNKRIAEEIERARRTELARGEVGIREKAKIPSLREFAEQRFLPHVESHFRTKPKTLAYYRLQTRHILEFAQLSNSPLDSIPQKAITAFTEKHRAAGYEVTSVNRALEALRRMLKLAVEWEVVKSTAKVRKLPGENHRDRVLSPAEESKYLESARMCSQLLWDLSVLLIDCALRPDEAYRMKWEHVRKDSIYIPGGKTASSRREIPIDFNGRVMEILNRRRALGGLWVFPAETKTGHISQSTLKKQHARAVRLAGIDPFVPYSLRHTCLTRWSRILDPYTLGYLAGHRDFATTRRYVHPNLESARAALAGRQSPQNPHSEA
jgi:integrase